MRKLTILVVVINAVGHVNACLGAAASLLQRGHRVIVVFNKVFQGKATALGFEEYPYTAKTPQEEIEESLKTQETPGEKDAKYLLENKVIGPFSVEEKSEKFWQFLLSDANLKEFIAFNRATEKAIERYKPDLIYYDNGKLLPAVYYSNIPWVRQVSMVPSFLLYDEALPPGGSGFPTNGDRSKWSEFNRKYRSPLALGSTVMSEKFVRNLGYEPFPDDSTFPDGQILTVYAYPEEINHPEIRQKESWFNLEVFNKVSDEIVDLSKLVPSEFLADNLDGKFSGKMIYLSMGSLGSVDLKLMRHLVEILAKTPHKYIVSKGPRHSEYSLARNMYGDRYLPQTSIIPHVDLVITHGGNNTVTEVFSAGKPMLVFPLFCDQFDNAQRLQETNYGARLDPYNMTESELVHLIDKLIYDQELKQRLQLASARIQKLNRHQDLAKRIEELVKC